MTNPTPPSWLSDTPAVWAPEPPTAEVMGQKELPEEEPEEETANRPSMNEPTVRLPKIDLPKFGEDPVKWMSFWNLYQSAVQLNSALSDVDKFNSVVALPDGLRCCSWTHTLRGELSVSH